MDLLAMFQFFSKGGLVMYPLLACSILSLGIGLERFLFHRTHHTDVSFLLPALISGLQQHDRVKIQEICHTTNGDIAKILERAFRDFPGNPRVLQQFLETESSLAAARLRERLVILENIVTLAPLLGLLGTVSGMIHTFGVMALHPGQAHAVTGGVAEALVATGMGLSVAIIAFIIHSYFANKLDKAVTHMEEVFGTVVNFLARSKYL